MRRRRMRAWRVVLVTSLAWLGIVLALFLYHIGTGCVLHRTGWESVDEPGIHYGSIDLDDNEGQVEVTTRKGDEDRRQSAVESQKNGPAAGSSELSSTYPPGKLHSWFPPPLIVPKNEEMPGELGQRVRLDKSLANIQKSRFKQHEFNIMASDMISVNRSLPDMRTKECKNKIYTNRLPDTSIIIVFHKEARSTLHRTIHSVINRSPRSLVKEIILVDDASNEEHLGKELEDYVAKLPIPIHVMRMGKRSGLIRARLFGAKLAKGSVLTFLDAHCECSDGWLEPLLYEIALNRKTVVSPVIDIISDKNFEYSRTDEHVWGGFNWKLSFRWFDVPPREIERRGDDHTIPLRSPSMAGGLFSMDRDYFYELGSYDTGMEIWGAENIEMSLRIWQCGGILLIVPCSHVGHVFRDNSPYTFPNGGAGPVVSRNTLRVAQVWLDETWLPFYIQMSPEVKTVDAGNVSDRIALRKKLGCKSFQWYLDNIFPESPMAVGYHTMGEVRNNETGLCLDTMGRASGQRVGIGPCHGMAGNQLWVYTKRNEIISNELCLDSTGGRRGRVALFTCHRQEGNQAFIYDETRSSIQHHSSGLCLTVPHELGSPLLSACDDGSTKQKWIFISVSKN